MWFGAMKPSALGMRVRRPRPGRRLSAILAAAPAAAALVLAAIGGASAQTASAPPPPEPSAGLDITLPQVEVVATTPLLGSGVDRSKVAAENTVLNSNDISRKGHADALTALNETAPGVHLDDIVSNPYQPT